MLALSIIAKDEVEAVKDIIAMYGKYFDEIAIAVDQRVDEFKLLETGKVHVYPYEWRDDFAHKRNWLAERIRSPYYFRMDTDDLIENPEVIRELADGMVANNIDILHAMYDYAKDEHGQLVARHWRETIIKKRPDIYWKKEIHENVYMEDQNACKYARDKRLKIIHNIDAAHAEVSSMRNIKYLLKEFERDGEKTDPRTLAYLGRMLMGKGVYDKAIFFLEKLVEKSGWDDDKYFAWVQMSQCYQFLGKLDMAVACCNEALTLNTKFPDAYIQMGTVYLQKEDYVKAVDWIMPGLVRPEPDTVMVLDPSFYRVTAKLNAAMALLGKGDAKMAMKYYQEAKKAAPNNPEVAKHEAMFMDAVNLAQYVRNLMWMACYVRDTEPKRLKSLMDAVPKKAYRDERVWSMRHAFLPPRKWADNEIAIFCGSSWEEWSPVSVLKGIGGSEEAVIYLSRELTKLGYCVTVFNNCGEMEGTYDGVEYKPYQAFNPRDTYSTLVSWRGHDVREVSAGKKLLWLHDVPIPGMFTPQSVAGLTKIIVLSQYHKSLLPDFIPDNMVFISSNGIDADNFHMNGVVRDAKRLIYTSSYDRGLEHLLRMWPQVRQDVPDATLHIFYGWDTYDKMVAKGARDGRFKRAMIPLMLQDGIVEHGRVGHKQLATEFMKSGVWAYPCHFEEISCISAMKAQAAGCVPVCTDYAALNETVKAGVKIGGNGNNGQVQEMFRQKLVEILKDEARQEEVRTQVLQNKDLFGWERVALSWHENILIDKAYK